MESETAYSLLHLPRTATSYEILYAYRRESLKYHPRRFDPGERFIEIHFKKLAGAYETLIDPQKREEYDRKLTSKDKKVKHSDSSRFSDPQQQLERQRRHSALSVPTRLFSAGHHLPGGTRNLLNQSHSKAAQPIPIQQLGSASASRVDLQPEPRARRSSISGLAPVPNLNQFAQLKPQPRIPPSSSFLQSKPFNPSSIQPPTRAGSCVPALETSSFKQNTSRLDESLLSMRLNQYPNSHGSQPSSSQQSRINRQSIINELNNRARANSTAASKPTYPISSTSSSSTSSSLPPSISPSSSLSSSTSPRQPSKFSSSPSSGAPLSRMNYPSAPDLSAHFKPPRHLSSHDWFLPSNDEEYQPLVLNASSQSQSHKRPLHPRPCKASASYASQLCIQRRDFNQQLPYQPSTSNLTHRHPDKR